MPRSLLVGLVLGAAFAFMVAGSALRTPPPPSGPFEGAGPVLGKAPGFELRDQRGRTVALRDIRGPWVAAFIFTRCARECPMMTSRMKALSGKVPGARLVSFSLDPRDRPEDLMRFSRFHRAGWTFLTGGPGEVRRLAVEGFKLPAGEKEGGILHSDRLVLVDAEGSLRGYFDPADEGALLDLAARYRALAVPH